MTELEKLNERITRLTELVKSGSEAIKAMEIALKNAEEERDRLADQRREQEPMFERVGFDHDYYTLGFDFNPVVSKEIGCHTDTWRYENNNYFHTKERTEEVAEKIRLLLKLERLHDIYCPEYVPDWIGENSPHCIFFNHEKGVYSYIPIHAYEDVVSICFPTTEIAQKVCDILNTELEGKK